MIIGRRVLRGAAGELYSLEAATGKKLEPSFGGGQVEDVDQACALAESAFDAYRALPDERRAAFLEKIAEEILALGDDLIVRAMQESGLPRPRLEGERGRTVNQLRNFAALVRAGRWHGAVIDSALPDRKPAPRPDLRQRRIALGPVAVFGASNFPLAFSVAGGDTASALAAGCPVIVKGHSAHLGTCELVGRAVQRAAIACDMPEGVFSLLFGAGSIIGQALVENPAVQAVGFTGSRRAGLELVRIAQSRRRPIPVYAEMSSINPVFLLPGALAARAETIGRGFADSLTLGTGQFCTNPGLVIGIESESLETFVQAAAAALAVKPATTMLTPGIHAAYTKGVSRLEAVKCVQLAGKGVPGQGSNDAHAAFFRCAASDFLADPTLEEENFGPSSLLVVCRNLAEMRLVAARLEGQLTATLQMDDADVPMASQLLPALERLAGRILVNDFPTGVEVCNAMVHGGPFPATSDSRTTSVGSAAIERFLRPVCYQNLSASLLPESLKDDNPLGLWRLRDGVLARE